MVPRDYLFFSLNIILNLSDRIKITLRQFRDEGLPVPERIEGLSFHHAFSLPGKLNENTKRDLRDIVSGAGYRVKAYPEGIFASKGRFGYWGITAFHGSILIILTGVLVSSLSIFRGNFEISEGQIFSGKKEEFIGRVYGIIKLEPEFDFSLLLRKYNAEYWDKGYPKLYRSTIDVIENGKTLFSKDVEMNEPLRYKGYSFYQSKYHGYSAALAIRDKEIGYEMKGYVNFPYQGHYPGIIAHDFEVPQTQYRGQLRFDAAYPDVVVMKVLENNTPVWEGILPKEGAVDLGKIQLVFHGMVQWTGLFVARDWGVPVVYAGFALLILSVFVIVFIVPKTFSAFYDEKRLLVGAKALRDKEIFKEEFEGIAGKIERILNE